jgi:hypothetical protein
MAGSDRELRYLKCNSKWKCVDDPSVHLVLRPTAADHRVMEVVFRSSQQLHYFNCPAQARTPHRRRAEL